MVVKVNDDIFNLHHHLKDNIDIAKKEIKNDWDMVFVVDGAEGSGKSVLAQQIAYYCDSTLSLDRVVFTPEEFKKAIINSKPYQSIIYDEAYTGLSARATMSTINRTLVSMLAEIRQKNLFVFVVMPTFFDLDKYVALWRSRALIHVYTNGFKRGTFMFFNADQKKKLYIYGKKFYNYSAASSNFLGNFTKFLPLDIEAYKQKKRDALVDRENDKEKKQDSKELKELIFERLMGFDEEILDKIPINLRAQIIGITKPTYYSWVAKYEENGGLTGFS